MRYLLALALLLVPAAAEEAAYYVIETLPVPEGIPFEVSGLAMLPDGRLAVSIRKGEVWAIANPEGPIGTQSFARIASALHEPLGLAWHDGGLYVMQRGELTRMEDRDSDGVMDAYLTVNNDWGLSGNYHEYAFGPVVDRDGNFWITLNQTIGKPVVPEQAWRGWGARISPDGVLQPVAPGMRSPCGLGLNLEGDAFFTDQQGNWVPAGTLHHLREGVFFGHIESLRDVDRPGSTLGARPDTPGGKPYPEAIRASEALVPPAVWFPYRKMGMSTTDILVDATRGAFGPFAGQLFVGEFTMAQVNRVFLEKINGEYQGGCIPFRSGFQCAVLRMAWGPENSLFVGETNRGWNSVGSTPFGIERVRWTGETPFEILAMHATHTGFRVTFTAPVDPLSIAQPGAFSMSSYTWHYHLKYGSDEIDVQDHAITEIAAAPDALSVNVTVEGLRPLYLHELHAPGVRSAAGAPLLHPTAYYTLNAIPAPEVDDDTPLTPLDEGTSSPR